MSWITIIISIITNLPAIIDLVIEIINMFRDIKDRKERRAAMKELVAAVKLAKETGDTSKVEALYTKYVSASK